MFITLPIIRRTVLFFVALSTVAYILMPQPAAAQVSDSPINLIGWAWSAYLDGNNNQVGVGWISLHCRQTNSCGSIDYGVTVDTDGSMQGYAWSGYQDADGNQVGIGWIDFGVNTGDIPAGFPNRHPARVDANGDASGWVRAVSGAAANDGWDGWISLGGPNYGVGFDTDTGAADNNSAAWGGDMVVGWVDFSRSELALPDLTIPGNISYQVQNGDEITGEYETATFSFGIHNIGNEDTALQQNTIDWEFEIEDLGRGGSVTRNGNIGAQASGDSDTVTVSENNFLFGEYRLTATVDPNNDINEWDLDNNDTTRVVTIEPEDIDMDLEVVSEHIIRAGDTAEMEWSRTDVEYDLDCRVIGPGLINQSGNATSDLSLGSGSSGTVVTNPRHNFSRYEFICTEPMTGAEWSADSSVEVIPAFQEL